MIHINLLPVRQIKQRLRIRNEVAIFVASMVGVGVISSSVIMGQMLQVSKLTGQNKILSSKKASYQPILDEIEKLKKDKKEQETKLEVIKKLKANSQLTVHLLDEIAKIFPANRLWLNSMRQVGNSLELSGVALDNATIAQFMESINESKMFQGAELSQTQQTSVAGAKLKSFSLRVGITPPQEAKAAPTEAKK